MPRKTEHVAQKSSNEREGVPRRRWMIASLLGFGVLVNFFDRVNLSVSQDALHATFGISTVQFGYLLSAYSWTYCLLQLPSGVLLDRFGVRQIGRISTFLWSMASFGAAAASGLKSFVAARFLLGVGEAPTFPGNSQAVGYWFPARERSLATACFDSAAKLGPAVGQPLIGLLLLRFGWRWSFAATGFMSFLYFVLFYWVYRNPSEDKSLTDAERNFIVLGGAQPEGAAKGRRGAALLDLLGQRKVIGLVLGSAAYNYTFYLLLTWVPSYLSKALHVVLVHSVVDRSRGKRGKAGRNSKLWQSIGGHRGPDCHGLYCGCDALVCVGVRGRSGVFVGGHRRICFFARANRTDFSPPFNSKWQAWCRLLCCESNSKFASHLSTFCQSLKSIENLYRFHPKNRFDTAAFAASNASPMKLSLLFHARGEYEKHFSGSARFFPGSA